MNHLRPSRRELLAEGANSLFTVACGFGILLILIADLTVWERIWSTAAAVAVVAAIVAVLWLRARRRRGSAPPLGRAGRRRLNEAVLGMGHLPPDADESWRPALRHEATRSFWLLWLQNLPLLSIGSFSANASDPATSTVEIAGWVGFVAVGTTLIAWGRLSYGGFRQRNAVQMLQQLDAQVDA